MDRLRTASYIGLVVGVIVSVVGGALESTVYGCVPSANVPCHPSPPPEVVLGGYVFYLGVVVIIVSLVVLVFSLKRQPSVVV